MLEFLQQNIFFKQTIHPLIFSSLTLHMVGSYGWRHQERVVDNLGILPVHRGATTIHIHTANLELIQKIFRDGINRNKTIFPIILHSYFMVHIQLILKTIFRHFKLFLDESLFGSHFFIIIIIFPFVRFTLVPGKQTGSGTKVHFFIQPHSKLHLTKSKQPTTVLHIQLACDSSSNISAAEAHGNLNTGVCV